MRILFLHKQILFPRDTGGKIRVLNILKHLGARHEITYLCNLRHGEDRYLPEMRQLQLRMEPVRGQSSRRRSALFYFEAFLNVFSSRPFSVNRNYDPRVRAKLKSLLREKEYDLVICDQVQMALHTIGLPIRSSVLFQHNVEAQILERHAQIGSNMLTRAYMTNQWHKMRSFERSCGDHFNSVIAVSVQDKEIFERDYGWKNVHAIDTAVDTEYFQPIPNSEIEDRVMFLGSMDWMPNQDGVAHFVRNIWPEILKVRPKATFHIVGRNPPNSVKALAEVAGVTVVGAVPDVRPHLATAAVVVVPLLVGGGTRLKIYEAMAMERPVVSTVIGAEGLPIIHDRHFLSADLPGDFANAVVRLLSDGHLRRQLGEASNRFVRENYSSERVADQFERICYSVADIGDRLKQQAVDV